MNQWDLATKKWEPKHHDVLCSKYFEKKRKKKKRGGGGGGLHRSHTTEHSVLAEINVYRGVHRVTDLEKNVHFESRLVQGWSSVAIAFGPLFISLLPIN